MEVKDYKQVGESQGERGSWSGELLGRKRRRIVTPPAEVGASPTAILSQAEVTRASLDGISDGWRNR